MSLDTLKKKRATSRSCFTRTAKILKDELEKDSPDKSVLGDKFIKLQTVISELKSYDSEMLDLMIAAKVTEENLETEVISCEEYSDEFISMSRRIKEKLDNSDLRSNMNSKTDSNINTCDGKRYKLPKIEIKKFDGQLLSYLSFWGQFKKIHEDKNLDDVDKFHYLAQSMLPGTRAFELIDSYPLTSENYPKAISAFEERFGNKEILTEIYVRELLKLIIQNVRSQGKDKLPLVSLYDKIESHLRALESLGVNQDSNTAWLYPMVESCLSAELIRVWQRSVLFSTKGPRLSNLLEFLRKEVEGEQRVKLARSGFELSPPSREERPKESKFKNKKPFVSAASLVAAKEIKCVFCGKVHESKECISARSWSLKERLDKLRELKCCLRCLKPGHFARDCKQFIQCHVCKRSHHIILCPEIQEKMCESAASTKGSTAVQTTMSTPSCMKEVLLMTLMVEVVSGDMRKRVRCLLDCGSQRSYVLKSTAEALHLKSLSSEKLTHTLFGGMRTESKNHKRYSMRLRPVGRGTEYQFCFLDQDTICGGIPRIPKGPLLRELKEHRIWISDMGDDYPEIEILIGSDIYGQILTGEVIQLNEGLTAINTKLGWTLCGEPKGVNIQSFEGAQSMLVTNLHVQNMKVSDMWDLEKIGITDEAQTFSKAVEDQLAQEQFLKGLRRNEDGRYCVSLPWVQKFPPNIASNRHIAEKRLFAITRKLKKSNNFDEYDKIFNEWLSEDVVEIIPESEKNVKGHYLPHHPVVKLDSLTSKIRPVFDASCKSDNSLSLNDCLAKGPNLVEEIPAILMRFREKAIGVTSDIRRAFLQIGIKQEDQNYLKFLWWKNNKIVEFRHKRVVFGVTSSPYLLAAVISFHLEHVRKQFEVVAQKLLNSFYVDNCVTSVDTSEELEDFMTQATDIMAEAKMELRMWTFGTESEELSLQSSDPVSPVLGLQWDRLDDSFFIPFKTEQISDLSKRKLLSIVHSVFDPLGFVVPIMIPAKLILQEAWATEANWDLPLPDELKIRFLTWYKGLSCLSQLKFPRRIGYGKRDSWSLHVFCDASKNAYATVIFLRSKDNDRVYVKFVAAKSRVSPLKKVTIPRLELLACVLGARLAKYIVDALFLKDVSICYWTDATVALCWIQREENWGVFVNNRVKEIRSLSKKECWRHIPGKFNPADIASRGCTPQHLLQYGWWEGPEFLKTSPEAWPESKFSPDEELIAAEMKKKIIAELSVKVEKPEWFERFSSFSKIVRVFCWMMRFVNKLRKKPYNTNALTVEEISRAEIILWSIEQKKYFQEKENSVHGLQVVRGNDDVLRVKTKIIERDDELSFLYPVLLPSKHHLTECLIQEYHLKYCHAGVQILAAKLRLQYWIISAKRNIRACVTRCVVCKRFTAKALTTPPIQLPLDRVRESAVFEVTGIDLCGPLLLKPKGKAWIVLFTCAVYRAIHLEPLTSLSTESFLQALRRFIARRGRPSTVYSDNGTNFRGTDNVLKRIDWQKITENECYPIKWKFIPPTAAWWGGWWERLIRSVKTLLVRILGRSSVNFEELLTILCDVEATINSRPLTYVSDDSDELIPLTPSLFLQDIKQVGVPDLDSVDSYKLNVRVNYCNTLRRELRNRFRKEYLGQLVQKAKVKCQELKVGDVVLIELENKKRVVWPMGKIVKIYNSRDGASRVVQVKTNNGCLTRPIQKLYPLEVSTAGDPVLTLTAENRSRYGRLVKPRIK